MKKYIYTIIILLSSGLFFSCNEDIDGKLDGVEDVERPKETGHYKYTIVETDYNTISKGLKADGFDDLASKITKEKEFSEELSPFTLIPYMLPSFLKSPDVGASVDVTYNYNNGRTAKLISMSSDAYVVSSEDYVTAWGDPSVDAFTSAKPATSYVPAILKAKMGEQAEGALANVNYFFSAEEPYPADVRGEDHMAEDFEDNPSGAGTNVKVDLAGWINTDLKGVFFWQSREYSKNKYAQVSAYKSGTLNDIWLISPQVDLTKSTNPRFAFDIVVGNYNKTCLKVYVSDNFDGNQANILSATWTDITSNFTLPTPASGYSTWDTAGSYSLSAYKGKKIHVAFRYEGDDAVAESDKKKTTTYQIDNIAVHENIPGIAVDEKELVHDLYELKGEKWTKVTDAKTLVLQPADYKAMGVAYLSTSNAPEYLDNYMKLNYPFAKVGDIMTIVYKTSADGTKCYADEFTLLNEGSKVWTPNSFKEVRTDQFIFAASKKWIFDPTFVVKLEKGKADTDGYMMVVNYVKQNQALENPKLVNSYGDSEYYYGFSGNYGNVSYREVDRLNDVEYAALGEDIVAKRNLMNRRTEEGVHVFLTLQYPDAAPITNGVEQEAKVSVFIFRDYLNPQDLNWEYRFKCVGDKKWEFIERKSEIGTIEKAGGY